MWVARGEQPLLLPGAPHDVGSPGAPGGGARAGTTHPSDRQATAREPGVEAPAANGRDAVASRDTAVEFLSATAIAMVHLSRLSEELVIWSTAEFGFVELSDAYSTGSSLMPQKKNPDVPELVRGKTGRAIGNLVTLLTVLKGLPLAYNRDLQEDKQPIFDSAATLRDSLEVTAGAIATLRVDVERMRTAADDPMLLATDLAEILVREGVPFREAHQAVGRVVQNCLSKHLDLRQLSREDLAGFPPAFPSAAPELFDLGPAAEARPLMAGTARGRWPAAQGYDRASIRPRPRTRGGHAQGVRQAHEGRGPLRVSCGRGGRKK